MDKLPDGCTRITARGAVEMNPEHATLSRDPEGREIAAFDDGSYSYGGMLWERVLSADEKQRVDRYLAAKYG